MRYVVFTFPSVTFFSKKKGRGGGEGGRLGDVYCDIDFEWVVYFVLFIWV